MNPLLQVLLALSLTLFASSVTANESKGSLVISGFSLPYQDAASLEAELSLELDIEIKWRAWIIFEEPVLVSEARWRLNKIYMRRSEQIQTLVLCRDSHQPNCIPDTIAKHIKPIDLRLLLALSHSEGQLGLILDPGVFAEPSLISLTDAEYSYNTPGSPSWDKLIVSNMMQAQGYGLYLGDYQQRFLSKEQAQAVFSPGFNLVESLSSPVLPLVSVVSYAPLVDHLIKQQQQSTEKQASIAQQKQIEQASKAIKAQTEDDIFADFEQDYMKEAIEQQLEPQRQSQARQFKHEQQQVEQHIAQDAVQLADKKKQVASRYMPSESLTPRCLEQGLCGYVNTQGSWVIEPKFDTALNFQDGQAKVTFDTQYKDRKAHCRAWTKYWKSAIIDRRGNYLKSPKSHQKEGGELCLTAEKL